MERLTLDSGINTGRKNSRDESDTSRQNTTVKFICKEKLLLQSSVNAHKVEEKRVLVRKREVDNKQMFRPELVSTVTAQKLYFQKSGGVRTSLQLHRAKAVCQSHRTSIDRLGF